MLVPIWRESVGTALTVFHVLKANVIPAFIGQALPGARAAIQRDKRSAIETFDPEVLHLARLWIELHGRRAEIEAGETRDRYMSAGDTLGGNIWINILAALPVVRRRRKLDHWRRLGREPADVERP